MGDEHQDELVLTASGRIDGRSARKHATRRKLMRAAADLFAEQGYAGTSIDDIATAAGVSKGTVFYNFRNKADLFEQLVVSATEVIVVEIEAARENRRGWDALQEAMWRVLQAVEAHLSLSQIIVSELFRSHRPWSGRLDSCRESLTTPLAEVIGELAQERHAAGLPQVGIRPEHLPNVSVALLGGIITAALDRRAYTPTRPLEDVHTGLMLALAGLSPDGATKGSIQPSS